MEEIAVSKYGAGMVKGDELSDDEVEEARKAGDLLAPVEAPRVSKVKRRASASKRG